MKMNVTHKGTQVYVTQKDDAIKRDKALFCNFYDT